MRIALCTQQFGNYWSGLGAYATLLAKGLIDRGVELTIITPGDPITKIDALYHKVEPSKLDPTHGGWFSLSRKYRDTLKNLDADLIHFTDARESFAYHGDIPAVGTLHDDYFARHHWSPLHYKANYVDWVQRYFYYAFVTLAEKRGLKRLHSLIANSNCTAKTIAESYNVDPRKIRTIYIQPDLSANPLTKDLEDERISEISLLFVGGNIQRKGLPNVFKAIKKLIDTRPDIRLVILGKNQNLKRMDDIADKMGISKYIQIKGWVEPGQIADYYRKSSIFLMPSLMEGYGLVYLEAMAQGLPVIAGNVGGTKELIINGENGVLVDPLNVDELVQAIENLLTDRDLRASIISGGYRTVERLDTDEMVNSTLQVYEQTIAKVKPIA
jgi:glycosyltransferase involved in cell wall biosynthesis